MRYIALVLLSLAGLAGCSSLDAGLIPNPLAANWQIEEVPLADDRFLLSLKMKRYYEGGAGEARSVFNRRAKDLVQYGDFDSYEVLEYSEGMESSMLGSQRVCEGVIHLSRRSSPDQGKPAPARSTP